MPEINDPQRQHNYLSFEMPSELYNRLFSISPSAIVISRLSDGMFLDINRSTERVLGYSHQELIGKSSLELNIWPQASDRQSFIEKLKREGIIEDMELKMSTKAGELKDLLFSAIPCRLNGEECMITTWQDITDTKRAGFAIEEMEKFKTLTENLEDLIVRLRPDALVLHANPALYMYFCLEKNSLLNKQIDALDLGNENCQKLRNTIQASQADCSNKNIEMQLPNGKWMEWIVIPEADSSGRIISVILNGRDRTDKKEYEEKIKATLKSAKELNLIKSRLVSMVSHEFRTPLAAILSSAELLNLYESKLNIQEKEQHFSRIIKSVEYLTKMLDDVMVINRSETGALNVNFEACNVVPLIKEFISDILVSFRSEHDVQLSFPDEEIVVSTDKMLLRQILTNVLSNAIKFSSPEKGISIRLQKCQGEMNLEITDQGIGIPEEFKEKVFAPFCRASNISHVPGTGLGLSITKQLVELLRGKITFMSTVNNGTTFTITLPLI